jgi:hypothetical protein
MTKAPASINISPATIAAFLSASNPATMLHNGVSVSATLTAGAVSLKYSATHKAAEHITRIA